MSEQEKIQLFEDQKIRTAWDTEKEEWYFSVTDVTSVLTGQQTARGASNYWAKLKQQLKEGGADKLLTNCQQLKMTASDGKHRATDVAIEKKSLKGVMRWVHYLQKSISALKISSESVQMAQNRIAFTINFCPFLSAGKAFHRYEDCSVSLLNP